MGSTLALQVCLCDSTQQLMWLRGTVFVRNANSLLLRQHTLTDVTLQRNKKKKRGKRPRRSEEKYVYVYEYHHHQFSWYGHNQTQKVQLYRVLL